MLPFEEILENLVIISVGERGSMCYVWRSEDNLGDLAFSFHHVGPWDQTQVISSAAGVFTH